MPKKNIRVGIVGNPNCGKTTIFNALTGLKNNTGNWPGVTIAKKSGFIKKDRENIELVDLPGIYSFGKSDSSVDEKITEKSLLQDNYDLVVNVVDASNLLRNLYLTIQMLEMNLPMILVLNMADIARQKDLKISFDIIAQRLGIKVLSIIAKDGEGIDGLKKAILDFDYDNITAQKNIAYKYNNDTVCAVEKVMPLLPEKLLRKEWVALQLLESSKRIKGSNIDIAEEFKHMLSEQKVIIEERLRYSLSVMIPSARYEFISEIIKDAVKTPKVIMQDITSRVDRVLLHKHFGIPLFFFFMYCTFAFSIVVGGAFQDFFEDIARAIFIIGTSNILDMIGAHQILHFILSEGVGGGVVIIAPFIPVIWCMYIFLSLLEDSGYMTRAAFIMDKVMKKLKLPGKSLIPLIIGFGCNVPSVMAARTIENVNDRVTTIIMSPFMSCTARLTVYLLFCVTFFPQNGQSMVFLLYIIGMFSAIMIGFIMKTLILEHKPSNFIMELPHYKIPSVRSVVMKANHRVKTFVLQAGKYILFIFLVLHLLFNINCDGSVNDAGDDSSIVKIGKSMTPILKPIGISSENWPAAVGIFTGIFAKELIVGTMGALYSSAHVHDEDDGFWEVVVEAFNSVGENFNNMFL